VVKDIAARGRRGRSSRLTGELPVTRWSMDEFVKR
jgi:hypothetical protein